MRKNGYGFYTKKNAVSTVSTLVYFIKILKDDSSLLTLQLVLLYSVLAARQALSVLSFGRASRLTWSEMGLNAGFNQERKIRVVMFDKVIMIAVEVTDRFVCWF